jgi:hypothetical protein
MGKAVVVAVGDVAREAATVKAVGEADAIVDAIGVSVGVSASDAVGEAVSDAVKESGGATVGKVVGNAVGGTPLCRRDKPSVGKVGWAVDQESVLSWDQWWLVLP